MGHGQTHASKFRNRANTAEGELNVGGGDLEDVIVLLLYPVALLEQVALTLVLPFVWLLRTMRIISFSCPIDIIHDELPNSQWTSPDGQ